MGSEAKAAPLNPSQLLAVAAALRVAEETIGGVERLLAEEPQGITIRLAGDLTPEQRRVLGTACGRIRASLVEACRRLGVEPAERSRRGAIRGELSTLWAMIEDTKSGCLRGYGPLPADAAAEVDEVLGRISQELVGILRVVA
jgi:hypothetical protein